MSCSVNRKYRPWLEVKEVGFKAKDSAIYLPDVGNRDYSFVKVLTKDCDLFDKVCIAEFRMAKTVELGRETHVFLEEFNIIAVVDNGEEFVEVELIKADADQFLKENNPYGNPSVEEWRIAGNKVK